MRRKLNNVTDTEISRRLHDIVANMDLFGIDENSIPDELEGTDFTTVVGDILFNEFKVLKYIEILEKDPLGKLDKDEHIIEQIDAQTGSVMCNKKIKFVNVFVEKHIIKNIENKIKKLKEEYKNSFIVIDKDTKLPLTKYLQIEDISAEYKDELLDDDKFWKHYGFPQVMSGKIAYREKLCKIAKEKFRKEIFPDKKRFADGIVIYSEIFRYCYDIKKIIRRFLLINKWIQNKPTRSNLLCLHNTKLDTGRNGKTIRLEAEKRYMKENHFAVGSQYLNFKDCGSEQDFTEHLYYNDEYGFEDTNTKILKKIHMNKKPTLPRRILYKGQKPMETDAFFYLASQNGRPLESIVTSARAADCITTTDAHYRKNKDKLTNIYFDKPSEREGLFNQISYKDLFDALLKCTVKYDDYNDEEDELEDDENDNKESGIRVPSQLIKILKKECEADKKSITFSQMITSLGENQYFNGNKAKQTVQDLHDYLKKHYEYLIVENNKNGNKRKNWVEKELLFYDGPINDLNRTCTIDILNNINANAIEEVSYEIKDREEIKRYVYNLYGIDPDLPFENPSLFISREKFKPTYEEKCNTFIPVTITKMENEYLDKKKNETLKLIYEGVNLPRAEVKKGNFSRFTNDNMWLMSRFLVEYDAPKDASEEDIQAAKQEMIELSKQWPTFRVVDSGNKSIHILFCFDVYSFPQTVEEFKFAVDFAVKKLNLPDKIGCAELDRQALLDPSRITRRPGVKRENGQEQTLISFNKNYISVNWRDEYQTYYEDELEKEKDVERIKILTEPITKSSAYTKKRDIVWFVEAYIAKHDLIWKQGQRHSTAAKIAGACNKAGFKAEECVSALQRLYPNDCSADPSIVSNLGKYFDE